MRNIHFSLGAIAMAVVILVGCGGGGTGGAGATSASPSLSGTAAVGAPLPDALVTLKDANGKELTVTADSSGVYTFPNVTGVVAPIMLKATGMAGGTAYTLYSMASAVSTDKGVVGVVNVTPVTDSVVSQALGSQAPETVFGDGAKIKAIDTVKLADAKAKLTAALANVLTALGQDPAKVDLFTTQFTANNTGLDKLLDLVQVSSVMTAAGSDMRVADKSTGQATTIKAADTIATVTSTALPSPGAEQIALNTATIKTLFASFNALTGSQADLQGTAMQDLFDVDFLDGGNNRATQMAQFWKSETDNAIGFKFLDYVLGGCDAASKVCGGEATLQKADGSRDRFALPVKQGSDGKWRAYGNQAAFDFDLKPVVKAYYTVNNGNKSLSSLATGVNLYIPASAGTKAILYTSNDSGSSWTPSMGLVSKSGCSFLAIDDQTIYCNNFKSVSDDNANAVNGYVDQGVRRFKIVLTTTAGDKTFVGKSGKQLFTQATGQSAVDRAGLGINHTQLGTSSVTLLGSPEYVWANFVSGANGSAWSWESAALAKLKGVVTVAAANTACKSSGQNNCDQNFNTSTGTINSVMLSGRDATGRGVWLHHSLASTGTALAN